MDKSLCMEEEILQSISSSLHYKYIREGHLDFIDDFLIAKIEMHI